MPEQPKAQNRPIVAAVDGSASSDAAVQWAAREALLRTAPLKLVHIVATPVITQVLAPAPVALDESHDEKARRIVGNAVDLARSIAGDAGASADFASAEIYYSAAIPTLIDLSKDAALVVVGSRGHSVLRHGLLGSVSTALVQHAHCPVAVIHDTVTPAADRPVVVGIDCTPASELATSVAFHEAALRGVELVAVHALSDSNVSGRWPQTSEIEEVLAERLAGWCTQYPDVAVRRVVVRDQPAHNLAENAVNAQLLVVGSRGRGGFTGMMLGSVSRTLAHSVSVPLIIARES